MTLGDPRLPDRFWDKVHVVAEASTYPGPCWVWGAGVDARGYGRFGWNGANRLAHRVAYTALVGEPDADLDHLCRITCCVNPEHLEDVSRGENIARGLKGYALRKQCSRGHKIESEADVKTFSGGTRFCLSCYREDNRRKGGHH